MGSTRVLFVNITRQCNVLCDRCYLTLEHRTMKERLSSEALRRVITHPFFRECEEPIIVWEGGEAILVGEALMKDYVDLVSYELPHAKQRMVTNFLVLPNWLIDLAHSSFEGHLETTFALAGKATLDGSRERYLEQFEKSTCRAVDSDLTLAINVELNTETAAMGPRSIVELAERTGAVCWEFDISIDFARFRKQPVYNEYGYPMLPLTLSYSDMSKYLIAMYRDYGDRLKKLGFQSSIFDDIIACRSSMAFNVRRELDFITLNPDGYVTTNPLFSDLTQTYLGNVLQEDFDSILQHPNRVSRAQWEAVRIRQCVNCEFVAGCHGGPSHAPVLDGSGDCAGSAGLRRFLLGWTQ